MRIAQMIDSLHVGGAEKLQVTFAAAAREQGLQPTIISLRHDPGSPVPGQLRALGARVVEFPSTRKHTLVDVARMWRVGRFLREERFDVLHTHLGYANITGALLGRALRLPVVASLHSTGFYAERGFMIHRIESLALRLGAARVIAVGKSVAERHRGRFGKVPIVVIPNAVATPPDLPPQRRDELRALLTGDPTRPLLISVGRLVDAKGFPDLLRAFASLRADHPQAVLAIVGDGEMRGELAALLDELALTDSALLLGTRNDVPNLLAASDIYVNSSHWEGLPVSVLEAMAAGLPIVATRVGDVPEVVSERTGILVPPHQPPALAAALRALLDDPARREGLGRAGRDEVSARYSHTAWFNRLLDLYQEVAPRPRPAATHREGTT